MKILAVDPGPKTSAVVVFDPAEAVIEHARIHDNVRVLTSMGERKPDEVLVCEMIACYGMPVGAEVFETCVWIGRFAEAWGGAEGMDWFRVTRHTCKMHLCHSARANDSNIRQALIDRFGKPGTKANMGKTYGVSKDMWAALAVAVTFADLKCTIPIGASRPIFDPTANRDKFIGEEMRRMG